MSDICASLVVTTPSQQKVHSKSAQEYQNITQSLQEVAPKSLLSDMILGSREKLNEKQVEVISTTSSVPDCSSGASGCSEDNLEMECDSTAAAATDTTLEEQGKDRSIQNEEAEVVVVSLIPPSALDSTTTTFSEPHVQIRLSVTAGDPTTDKALEERVVVDAAVVEDSGDVIRVCLSVLVADDSSRHSSENCDSPSASTTRGMTPDDFTILCVVGQGSYGKVFQVMKKSTGEIFALKVMQKEAILARNVQDYTRALQSGVEVGGGDSAAESSGECEGGGGEEDTTPLKISVPSSSPGGVVGSSASPSSAPRSCPTPPPWSPEGRPSALRHTFTERDVLTKVQYPYIVSMRHAFTTETKLYLVLDFINGGHLFFQLYRHGLFSEEVARHYTAQMVLALGHLHSLGIIHRDLKPENILLDVDGHVRLTDFGLAKDGISSDQEARSFCGTAEYMAPEILQRGGHGRPADWWSIGILLWEMLTGTTPFQARNRKTQNQNILSKKLKFPPYLSNEVCSLLKGLLQKDPKHRLGCGIDGVEEIKRHRFFKKVNWRKLEAREIESPLKPDVQSELDTCNFDELWTNLPAQDSPAASPKLMNQFPVDPFEGYDF